MADIGMVCLFTLPHGGVWIYHRALCLFIELYKTAGGPVLGDVLALYNAGDFVHVGHGIALEP